MTNDEIKKELDKIAELLQTLIDLTIPAGTINIDMRPEIEAPEKCTCYDYLGTSNIPCPIHNPGGALTHMSTKSDIEVEDGCICYDFHTTAFVCPVHSDSGFIGY